MSNKMKILTGFGKPYKELHQVAPSGWKVWQAYNKNNFKNPITQADQALYEKMGWWGEIFHDKIIQRGTQVSYISNAGTTNEKKIKVNLPKNGYIIPTKQGWFVKFTLVPFRTGTIEEAVKACNELGIPEKQISYFYRLDNYENNERFAGRYFPALSGRFSVSLGRLPSSSGLDCVASRPVMKSKHVHIWKCEECGDKR